MPGSLFPHKWAGGVCTGCGTEEPPEEHKNHEAICLGATEDEAKERLRELIQAAGGTLKLYPAVTSYWPGNKTAQRPILALLGGPADTTDLCEFAPCKCGLKEVAIEGVEQISFDWSDEERAYVWVWTPGTIYGIPSSIYAGMLTVPRNPVATDRLPTLVSCQ